MNDLKFSVSICVYKNDNYIWFRDALKSIMIEQSRLPDEVILVVDGPIPDEINDVINEFEKRISEFKVIRLKENVGLGIARKIALDNTKYDIIALMDSDDISVFNRFELQLEKFASDEDLTIVGGYINEFIDDPSSVVATRIVPESDEEIKKYLKKKCPMNHVTVMFKKSDIQKVGGYKDWYYNEDYYLWIRLVLNNYKFANINQNLVNVRVGSDMYKRRGGWKYFSSEAKLQKYMKDMRINSFALYVYNVSIRFILQVLMPNKLRGFIFKKIAREKGIND